MELLMKLLLILSIVLSSNAYATNKCDLSVDVSKKKDEETKYVTLKQTYKSRKIYYIGNLSPGEDEYGSELRKADSAASSNCYSKAPKGSSTTCYTTEMYCQPKADLFAGKQEYYLNCESTTKAFYTFGGTNLSEAEYSKNKQIAECEKLDECMNTALNDNESTENYINKLLLFKEAKKCEQVQNFMFAN